MLVTVWTRISIQVLIGKINSQKIPKVGKVMMILMVLTAPKTRSCIAKGHFARKETFLYSFINNPNRLPFLGNAHDAS